MTDPFDIEAFRVPNLTPVVGVKTPHPKWCAIYEEDGPCTCGTEDVLDEIALEDAGLTKEDFQ